MNERPACVTAPGSASGTLTVYYDGACPLCRREIGFFRRRSAAASIEWVDVAAGDDEGVAPDLARADALARFHVRLADGTLASGARGFGALWAAVPGFAWLGAIARWRPAQSVLEAAYRGFLVVRPVAQRLASAAEPAQLGVCSRWLRRELRANHAGESGAVAIYRGILAFGRDRELRRFARRHIATEQRHLDVMCALVAPHERSRLLALWNAAGFVTGALPAVFGPRAVYATVDAVETFVDGHYRRQIERLEGDARHARLREALQCCRQDELVHRDQARRFAHGAWGHALRLWQRAVAVGSTCGVALARRV